MSLLNNSATLKNKAFKQPFTVKRTAAGTWNTTTGKWEPGADQTPVNASGSVQPATSKDMQWLALNTEGGQMIKSAVRIYTRFEFTPGVLGANGRGGDILEYKGLDWIVIQVADFAPHGHGKVFGVRIDGQDG